MQQNDETDQYKNISSAEQRGYGRKCYSELIKIEQVQSHIMREKGGVKDLIKDDYKNNSLR